MQGSVELLLAGEGVMAVARPKQGDSDKVLCGEVDKGPKNPAWSIYILYSICLQSWHWKCADGPNDAQVRKNSYGMLKY